MIKKNTPYKKIILATLISLTASLSFSQQNNEKKIQKLNKKFQYVSEISEQQHFLVGNRIVGPSDTGRGGGYLAGIKDLKIVDLDGKIIKESELNGYTVIFQFGRNTEKYAQIYDLQGIDGKYGLIDTDGKIIIPPTYNHINGFNSKGQAVAFTGNDLQVIDTNGTPLLKENYKYNVDYSTFFTIPTPGEINNLYVIANTIICSKDEKHYGTVNVLSGKTVVPFEYDKIENELVIKDNDTIGYIVTKNNMSTIVDYKANKELAPFPFEKVNNAFRDNNGNIYIHGVTDIKTDVINYYDVRNKKMIFQKEMNPDKPTRINNTFWVFEKDKSSFLYNTVKNETVKMPKEPRQITKLTDNMVLCIIYKESSWIYDLEKNTTVMKFQNEVSSNPFTLKKDNNSKEYFFIYENKNGEFNKSVSMYDKNLTAYFTDLYVTTTYYENDKMIIKEEFGGKSAFTAYDIDGKVIGEKRTYQLK